MEEISKELTHAMLPHELFSINAFGFKIPVTDTVVTTWIVMAFLIILSIIFTRKMSVVPSKIQNVVETLVNAINSMSKDAIGHHWRPFAPYIGSILLFLAISNIISIFDIIPSWEQLYKLTHIEFFEHITQYNLRPPTKDINVTAAMAIMSITLVIFAGIRYKKFSGWIKSFFEPMVIMFPFKILEYIIKPLSLCLRLFGNILAAFIIMHLVYATMPALVPAALSIYFDLFDGLLQAYIFVFLTSLYVGEAVE